MKSLTTVIACGILATGISLSTTKGMRKSIDLLAQESVRNGLSQSNLFVATHNNLQLQYGVLAALQQHLPKGGRSELLLATNSEGWLRVVGIRFLPPQIEPAQKPSPDSVDIDLGNWPESNPPQNGEK